MDQQSYKFWLKRNSSFYKEKCIVFEAGADDTFHANGKMLLKYHNGIHRIGQSPPKSGQNHLAAKNLDKITSENSFLVELNFSDVKILAGTHAESHAIPFSPKMRLKNGVILSVPKKAPEKKLR